MRPLSGVGWKITNPSRGLPFCRISMQELRRNRSGMEDLLGRRWNSSSKKSVNFSRKSTSCRSRSGNWMAGSSLITLRTVPSRTYMSHTTLKHRLKQAREWKLKQIHLPEYKWEKAERHLTWFKQNVKNRPNKNSKQRTTTTSNSEKR